MELTTMEAARLLGGTEEEYLKAEQNRAKHLGNFVYESRILNEIYLELRFAHGMIHIFPFFYGNEGSYEMRIDEKLKNIHLAYISINQDKRREGYGHKYLKRITDLADKYGYTMNLDVSPKFGVNKTTLFRFYKTHGFVREGRTERMYRNPINQE